MSEYIEVKGAIRGKGRPRFNMETGAIYTPKMTRDYEQLVAWCYKTQGGRNWLDQPVIVEIVAFYAMPKANPGKRNKMLVGELCPTIKPDADNIAKIIMDALNGVAYNDDKQVVGLSVEKRYAEEPKVIIRVERT